MKLFFILFLSYPLLIFSQILPKYNTNKIILLNENSISENDFFDQYSKKLGIDKDVKMVFTQKTKDKTGVIHSRFKQVYKGISVIGGTYILHSKNNKVIKSSGSLFPNIDLNTNPQINIVEANTIAKLFLENEVKNTDKLFLNLDVDNKGLCVIDNSFPNCSGNYRLAYQIIINNNSDFRIPVKKRIYIDAISGDYILAYDEIYNKSKPGKAKSLYYGEVELNTDSISPNHYILRDMTRGSGIFVYDYWNDKQEFFDDDNYWEFEDEGQNSAIDALYCTQAYYDFMKEHFNRNSIDNNGFPLKINVNIKSYVNAYWNGESATFGSGDCYNYGPLTTMALVAHEFTHGMTDFTSNLIYWQESGALNESLSDIFGESVEYFKDSLNFDWTIGSKFPRTTNVKPFRSMSNPNEFECPKYYKGKYWSGSYRDNYGVHTNSSILNYWFYLLVEGKQGISEGLDTFNVKSLGIDNALDIVYQMATVYLTENSNYGDAYEYSLEATKDLFGEQSTQFSNVKEAWKAVGIPKNLIYRPKKDIDFDILYNGKNDILERFCSDEFNDFEISFINKSTIPIDSGTLINLIINPSILVDTGGFFSKKVVFDTFDFELLLDKNWDIDSLKAFNISIDTTGYNLKRKYFSLNLKMTFTKDTIENTFRDIGSVNFSDQHENYSASMYFEDANDCDSKENKIENFRVVMLNRGCRNFSLLDSLKIVFSSDLDTKEYILNVKNDYLRGSFLIFNDIDERIDFDNLGDFSEYGIDMLYISDNNSTLLLTDSLKKYIHRPLQKNEVIDFNDNVFKNVLSIKKSGFFTDTSIINNKLKIGSKWNTKDVEDCLGYEDIFKVMEEFVSNATFCTDLDSFVEPYLKLELSLNSPKKNLISLAQGETNVIFIDDVEKTTKTYKIPLDKELSSNFTLSFLTINSYFLIDNIEVVEKETIDVIDFADNNDFQILNPISDNLVIHCKTDRKWDFILYDINGNRLMKRNSITGILQENINLASGIYYYKIFTDSKQMISGKITVIKR